MHNLINIDGDHCIPIAASTTHPSKLHHRFFAPCKCLCLVIRAGFCPPPPLVKLIQLFSWQQSNYGCTSLTKKHYYTLFLKKGWAKIDHNTIHLETTVKQTFLHIHFQNFPPTDSVWLLVYHNKHTVFELIQFITSLEGSL